MRIRWNIGDGRKVRFWWDCWATKSHPLIFYALAPVPHTIINKVAAEFVDGNGNWQWESFAHLLPNHIILRVASVIPPNFTRGDDQLFWAESNKGIFMVKAAYTTMSRPMHNYENQD